MRFNVTRGLRKAARAGMLALAGACWLVAAEAAPAAEPPAAELFFKRPAVLDTQLSPSGKRLAITAESKGRVGLFAIDLQGGDFKATAVAVFSDTDVVRFEWVDDERLVFSVIDLQEGLGEDRWTAPGLFAARFDGSELRILVARQGKQFITNGDVGKALTWNHVLLHVPLPSEDSQGARADEVIVGELQARLGELSNVEPRWLNTRTGRSRPLDTAGAPDHAVQWWFSQQGQPRAVLTSHEGRTALYWYRLPKDAEPGRWVQLAEGPFDAMPFLPAWVGAGETLYVLQARGPRGEQVVAPFDFATNKPGEPLVLVPGFDFRGGMISDRQGERLRGVRVDADAEQTVWFDPVVKQMQAQADAALPGRVNRITCRRCGAADAVMLVRSWSDRIPVQLLLWTQAANGGKGGWQMISTQQPGIDPKRMGSLDLVRIRARDGEDVPVWVTKPADFQAGQPRPAVMLVHGGPWLRQGHWRWEPMRQFLASRGYVVIEPEFRGSEGYGTVHRKAGYKQWGQAMQDDVTDALRWAQAEKIASDKACIVGGSYGGYSTLMGLIRDPDLYRCGSAWSAVADLMLFLEGGWFVSDDLSTTGRKVELPKLVGDAEKDRAMLLANSPVEQAARIKAPLQLIWGSEDLRVPIAHGKRLRSAMQKAGLEPEWVVYDGEAHGFRKTENQVDMALKLEAFLARHLK
ncbi:alpha/beta hydrolase family protein [Aquabacterium sp.]|uniref:alpha/beta hydrolase family protein n=1 Tax=Aquabacterium sp. TaxID=1872578 RepID=UPI003783F96B